MPYLLPMGLQPFFLAAQTVAIAIAFSATPITVYAGLQADFEAVQEKRLRSGLAALVEERQRIRGRYAEQELGCLERFLSASCLEEVRQGYARALRELDLVQESIELEIRQVQAAARQRARQEAAAQHAKAIDMRRTKP